MYLCMFARCFQGRATSPPFPFIYFSTLEMFFEGANGFSSSRRNQRGNISKTGLRMLLYTRIRSVRYARCRPDQRIEKRNVNIFQVGTRFKYIPLIQYADTVIRHRQKKVKGRVNRGTRINARRNVGDAAVPRNVGKRVVPQKNYIELRQVKERN